MIPLVDLNKQLQTIESEVFEAVHEVLRSCSYIQGKKVEAFEKAFAKIQGANYAVGCSNGTTALQLAYEALGLEQGDEIITVPNSFIATVSTALKLGIKPVFVDVDPETQLIDADKIEKAITKKTKAIVPVHLFGNPCNMKKIMDVARANKLLVVEDCAQSHLATYQGQLAGTFGDAATFSFYPGKNLGAAGDAGAVISKAPEVDERVRMLLDHGRIKSKSKYHHEILGYNYRMDEIQAAILSVKLKYLSEWTKGRQHLATIYNKHLHSADFRTVKTTELGSHVYYVYVVEVSNRDQVMAHLKEKDIQALVHFPVPLHLQPALKNLGYKEGDFPVAERLATRILSLPMFPEMTEEQINFVCTEFKKVARP